MNNSAIKLRPHHAVCAALFAGKGYNSDFTENMQSIVTELKTRPDTIIELNCNPDSLCLKCPNLSGKCASDKKSELLDVQWLHALNLREGDLLSWRALQNLVMPHLATDEALERICGSCECEWLWYCKTIRAKTVFRSAQ